MLNSNGLRMTRDNSRRKFLYESLYTIVLLLGGSLVAESCKAKKDNQQQTEYATVDSCNDLSGVSDNELKKRQTLGYVEESPLADNHCSNCNLYLPPGKEQACGGCMLFHGPVYASGYCAYWAPQIS